jgi:GT2 family glycosyltransferase
LNIAVVILNWNGNKLLEEFLPSVVKYSAEATIYVVDNASTDESVAYLHKNFPEVKCILNTFNGGYAEGYNRGLKTIEEDIYILLNNDVEVTENWLAPIINCFKQYPEIAVIQPKILDYKNPEYFEYAGAAGGFIDKYGYPFCRGRIFNDLERDHGQYDQDIEIFWASGACLAVRKKVFREAGGFDEDYFAHQEEIDLCWRIFNMNHKIWFCFQSRVFHLGGGTLGVQNPKKTFLNFRNSLFNILKNASSPGCYSVLFIRLILDGIACLKFLVAFQLKHIFAVLKAHISFYSKFYKLKKKRKPKQITKKYFRIHSIVIAYFIKDKKSFGKL